MSRAVFHLPVYPQYLNSYPMSTCWIESRYCLFFFFQYFRKVVPTHLFHYDEEIYPFIIIWHCMTIIKERKLVPNKDRSLLDKHYNLFQYWNDLLKLTNMSTFSLGKYQRSLLFYLPFLRVFLPWWHQGKIPGRRKYLRYLMYVKRKTVILVSGVVVI